MGGPNPGQQETSGRQDAGIAPSREGPPEKPVALFNHVPDLTPAPSQSQALDAAFSRMACSASVPNCEAIIRMRRVLQWALIVVPATVPSDCSLRRSRAEQPVILMKRWQRPRDNPKKISPVFEVLSLPFAQDKLRRAFARSFPIFHARHHPSRAPNGK